MIRTERAAGAAARAPSHRSRTHRWLTATLATLLVVAGLAILPAPQAGATVQTNVVTVDKECRLTASVLGLPVVDEILPMPENRTVTAPTGIERGETAQIRISSHFHILPTELEGATVNYLHNIQDPIRIGEGLEILGVSFVGGSISDATYTISGNTITPRYPGPYPPAVLHQPPDVVVEVRAVSTVGSVAVVEALPSSWQVNVTLLLTVNANAACTLTPGVPAPPNGVLTQITTLPGPYVPPGGLVTTATVNNTCSFNFNGTNVNNQAVNVPVTVTAGTAGAEGSVTTATIQPGPFHWQSTVNGFTPGNRRVQSSGAIRNVAFQFQAPAGYEVLDVSTSGAASASYDSGTGIISYLHPPTTGNAVSTPPPIQVELEVVDPSGLGGFSVVGHSFDYFTETQTVIFWGSGTWRNTVCAVASSPSYPAAVALPTAGDLSVTVANNDPSGVDLDVVAAATPGSSPINPAATYVVDQPQHGELAIDTVTGVITYTPIFGILETADSFTYLLNDTDGLTSNTATVDISIVGLYCLAGLPGEPTTGDCALDQFLEFDVEGDPLTMEQDDSLVTLATITLDGEPQDTSGLLNDLTVTNRRGDGQVWSVTGQVTDFKEDASAPNCPASNPSTWYYQCIPGDNLGWEPVAVVAHDQVPGDVAVVAPGSTITEGLSSTAQALCNSNVENTSGGTFTCGAVLTLLTPASAAAQVYHATLTLTLA